MTDVLTDGATAPAEAARAATKPAADVQDQKNWPVLLVLAFANFVVGLGAFMIVGMMIPVSEDLGMAPTETAYVLTLYAITYAVVSPLLVSATGRIGRRRVLTAGLAVFAVSAVMAGMAESPGLLFASRPVAAVGAGVITPITAAVAAAISPVAWRGRALAVVFMGLSVAQAFGMPIASYVAYSLNWQVMFHAVAGMAVLGAVLVWTIVPAGLPFAPVSLRDLGRAVVNLRLLLAVALPTFTLGSGYMTFAFFAPILDSEMGYGRDGITMIFMVAGAASIIGSLVGGQMADRIGYFRTLAIMLTVIAITSPLYSFLPLPFAPTAFLIVICFLQAGSIWASMPAQQARLISIAPDQASIILGLNAAAIYIGSAGGSAVGSAVAGTFGFGSLGLATACGVLLAIALLVLPRKYLEREQ